MDIGPVSRELDDLLDELDLSVGELGDSSCETEKPAILQELSRIDRRAFELAELVARDPKRRAEVKDESSRLAARLDILVDKLEADHAHLYGEWLDRISESYLDLWFVEFDSDDVSLRLGGLLH